MKYWSILLTAEKRVLNPEFSLKYIEILVSLKKLEAILKEKIAKYLCDLDVKSLKNMY